MAGREWQDTYRLEAILSGDTSRLKKAVDRAKRIIDSLDDRGESIEIDADNSPLRQSVESAKRSINSLRNESAEININADHSDFMSDVAESSSMVDVLKRKASVIQMNAEGLDKFKQLQSIKVKEVDMGDAKVSVAPEFDMSAATSRIQAFKTMLRSIPNKIRTRMEVDHDLPHHINLFSRLMGATDSFQRRMGNMARSIQSFGIVFANQIGGAAMMMSTSLIPIVASLAPAIMAMGNALGVAGGALVGLAGSFGLAAAAGAGFGGLVASVLSRYNSETFQATKESQRFTEAINNIKSTWSGIVDANMASVFTTMTNAINGANSALSALTPMFSGVSAVMEEASASFQRFIDKSPIAQSFFEMLNTTGVSVFETLLSAVGNFGAGFIQVLNMLEPLMVNMASGFQNLSERFLEWSQAVGTEKNFQAFAEYVQQALPLIGSIFGSTFQGIINLFASFGENSLVIFERLAQMAERFKTWSATIKESDGFQQFIDYVQRNGPVIMSLIGNIIMTVVNFAIALAPLAEEVLRLTDRFFEFTRELTKNHPVVSTLIGVFTLLAGAFMLVVPVIIQIVSLFGSLIMPLIKAATNGTLVATAMNVLKGALGGLMGTVGLIIGILATLAASFVLLWQNNEQFRTRVIEVWNQVKSHISNAVTAIKEFVQSIWGRLVEWWTANNENIMNVVQFAWNRVVNLIQTAMDIAVPIIKIAWESIKTVIKVALDVILAIVSVFFSVLNGDWSGAWQTIKDTGLRIWNAIKEGIDNVLNILLNLLGTDLETMKSKSSNAWEVIKAAAGRAWTWVKDKVSNLVAQLVAKVIAKFNEWKNRIQLVWETIKGMASNVWNSIKQTIVNLIQNLIQRAVIKFNTMKERVTGAWNQLKNTATSVWNGIKETVSNAITNLVNTARNKFQQMKTKVTNAWNNIKSSASNIWNSIKSTVSNLIQNLVDAAIRRFNTLKERVTGVWNQIKNTASRVWNQIKSTVSRVVGNILSAVRSKFEQVKSTMSNKMTQAKDLVTGIVSDIVSAISGFVGDMVSVGSDLIQGLVDGIQNMAGNAIDAATGVVDSAINGAKSLLGISSPSKVFKKIGMQTMQGAAIGITRNKSLMVNNVKDAAKGVTKAFKPELQTDFSSINSGIRNAQMRAKSSMQHTVNTEMSAPNMSLEARLQLGEREYKTFVGDISNEQDRTARLEEAYDL